MEIATFRRRICLLRCFRLRTLLAVVSVVCLVCGWEADRVQRRSRAIALLNHWELWVEEEEPALDGLPWGLLPEFAHSWLFHGRTTCLSVSDALGVCGTSTLDGAPPALPNSSKALGATSAERKQLVAAIATLKELPFVQVPFEFDDDDLRAMCRLRHLETLGFKTGGLTPDGVARIEKLPRMWRLLLDFDSPQCLPAKTIAAMSKLSRLESVIINGPLGTEEAARLRAALPRAVVDIHVPAR